MPLAYYTESRDIRMSDDGSTERGAWRKGRVGRYLRTTLRFAFLFTSSTVSGACSSVLVFSSSIMHPGTLLLIFLVIVFAVYKVLGAVSDSFGPRGLPGPALLPWIGRVHDVPIKFMWLKFKEWADIYGPMYHVRMLGTNYIVVSDETMAEELLVKRARINSDRPQIRSLYDSKSTNGSMEYLPLMGKNGKSLLNSYPYSI